MFPIILGDYVVFESSIVFSHENKLYLFNETSNLDGVLRVSDVIIETPGSSIFDDLGTLQFDIIYCENFRYFKINLPFDYDKIYFGKNYVYITHDKFHCLLHQNKSSRLKFDYVKTDIIIDPSQIYPLRLQSKALTGSFIYGNYICFVDKSKVIYMTETKTNIQKKISDGYNFIFSYHNMLCLFDSKNIIINGNLLKSNPISTNIVDFLFLDDDIILIIIVDDPSLGRYTVAEDCVFFNVNGLSDYDYKNDILFYCDNSTYFYWTTNVFKNSVIEKIKTANGTINVYLIPLETIGKNFKIVHMDFGDMLVCQNGFFYQNTAKRLLIDRD